MNNNASFVHDQDLFIQYDNQLAPSHNMLIYLSSDVCMDYSHFTNMQFHVGVHSLHLEYLPIHTQCNQKRHGCQRYNEDILHCIGILLRHIVSALRWHGI
eukprot:142212_1